MINKRRIGSIYEEKAVIFLKQKGYTILCKNYFTNLGEIDIIAAIKNLICFIEVKYRSSADYGMPSESVDLRKQDKIKKAAQIFLIRNEESIKELYGEIPYIRFDIVEILGDRIRLIEDAF